MKRLELRRHSFKEGDELTEEGIKFAVKIGESLQEEYTHLFTSGAQRATQTLACFLAGMGRKFGNGVKVKRGLFTPCPERYDQVIKKEKRRNEGEESLLEVVARKDPELLRLESERLANVFLEILNDLPDGSFGLAVSHSPLIEMGIYGLTGMKILNLKECEGVVITLEDDGSISIKERRIKTD